MALVTVGDLHNCMDAQIRTMGEKDDVAQADTGTSKSFWTTSDVAANDQNWAAGAAPSSEAVNKATVGAFPLPNIGAGQELRILQLWAGAMSPETNHTRILFDRLSQVGALSGTLTSPQTVNTPALTRYTDGVGVMAFIEIHTAIGTTTTTGTISYTNQAGTAGRTGSFINFGGATTNDPKSVHRIQLQSGDYGVRSVQSVTLAGTTGTAGSFAIVLARMITNYNRIGNTPRFLDWLELCLPKVDENACLWLVELNPTNIGLGQVAASNPDSECLEILWAKK